MKESRAREEAGPRSGLGGAAAEPGRSAVSAPPKEPPELGGAEPHGGPSPRQTEAADPEARCALTSQAGAGAERGRCGAGGGLRAVQPPPPVQGREGF